ncbi:DNA damage-inducible transcript 4-like protein [Eriocheir sinensis]|uniref:DNA damage-inducible transcript 4-like protein n=1 Tax=Eriocheir sinensis TaxID=95602 RepID=UPI0021C86908|nr:DNA damage-inducible transcript 4-like protein [Eriocheir sinensis]
MPPVLQDSTSSFSLASIQEEEEPDTQQEAVLVMRKLQSVLHRGVERYFTCNAVKLPRSTLLRAAHDILRLCSQRPEGLHGAVVDLYLNDGQACKRLAQVVADPKVDPKTVIRLTLHRDPASSDPGVLNLLPGYTMERSCLA